MNPNNTPENMNNHLEEDTKLQNGEIRIEDVPFYSQRLDEGNFEIEGFASLEEARYWSERICGLACLKMVLGKFMPEQQFPLKDLLDRGLAIGAYREDVGWIHQGLVNLAGEYGISGGRESIGQDIEAIAKHLGQERLVIPSVTVGFEAGKEYQKEDGSVYKMSRGGHLVVVYGATMDNNLIKELELQHPSSWQSYEWPSYSIDRERFANSFSEKGNIIYFESK